MKEIKHDPKVSIIDQTSSQKLLTQTNDMLRNEKRSRIQTKSDKQYRLNVLGYRNARDVKMT